MIKKEHKVCEDEKKDQLCGSARASTMKKLTAQVFHSLPLTLTLFLVFDSKFTWFQSIIVDIDEIS